MIKINSLLRVFLAAVLVCSGFTLIATGPTIPPDPWDCMGGCDQPDGCHCCVNTCGGPNCFAGSRKAGLRRNLKCPKRLALIAAGKKVPSSVPAKTEPAKNDKGDNNEHRKDNGRKENR